MSGARGAAGFWRAVKGRAYVRLVGSLRAPDFIVSDALFPNLGMCAFVLLYRALGAPKSYEALAVIGGILTTYWINVLWGMGAQLYWERQSGQLQLYFAAPCSRMAILTGMALGGFAATVLRSLVGVALGFWVFHVRLHAVSPGMLAVVFLVTMTALYALGMTLASVFLMWGRAAWQIANAFIEPVYFLSGLYFPISALGTFGAITAALIPLTLGVDALRQVLLGAGAHGLLPVPLELAALTAFAALFLWLSGVALRHVEHLAKHEGRLTLRWE